MKRCFPWTHKYGPWPKGIPYPVFEGPSNYLFQHTFCTKCGKMNYRIVPAPEPANRVLENTNHSVGLFQIK